MRPWFAALFVLAGILVGCGGDGDSGSLVDEVDGVTVVSDSAADQKIGQGLREYLPRNCPDEISEREKRWFKGRPALLKQAEAWLEVCSNVREIDVEDGRITVKSNLRPTSSSGRIGNAFCRIIQGSDVADFTSGHRLVGEDGETLKVCAARDAP